MNSVILVCRNLSNHLEKAMQRLAVSMPARHGILSYDQYVPTGHDINIS